MTGPRSGRSTTRAPATRFTIPKAARLEFGRRLGAWYRRNARDLPWRSTRDPYEVLVSELMLQQTQVIRVAPKYGAFLRQFPTLASVPASEPAQVMEAWQGLGYYARAIPPPAGPPHGPRPTVQRAVERRDACRDRPVRIDMRRSHSADGTRRAVLLVVRVENEEDLDRAGDGSSSTRMTSATTHRPLAARRGTSRTLCGTPSARACAS